MAFTEADLGGTGTPATPTTPASSTGTSYTFPSDLRSSMIYCNISVHRYQRQRIRSTASFPTVGVISLPMPVNLLDAYGSSIGSPNLGIFGALGQNLGAIEKAANEVINAASNPRVAGGAIAGGLIGAFLTKGKMGGAAAGAGVGAAVAMGPAGQQKIRDAIAKGMSTDVSYKGIKDGIATSIALNPLAGDGPLPSAARVSKGILPNPHTVSTFEGMRLKTFNLSWRLAPKSEAESTTLQNIVNFIKVSMHPQETFASFALRYPKVFRVTFTGAKDMPTIRHSFVTNFQINPYGSGQAAFFRSGYPTSYEINMELQELETLYVNSNNQITTVSSR